MSDIEFGEEATIIPHKEMNQEAINKMVEELLGEKLKEIGQSKGKDKICDDESKEESEE